MAHDRDLGINQRRDHWNPIGATLELDCTSAGSDELGCVSQGVLDRHVITHPWQVTDDQLLWFGPSNCGGVMRHVVDRDRECVAVAKHDHCQRITDQDHVGIGFADHASRWVVGGSDHDDRICAVRDLACGQRRGRQPFSHLDSPCCTSLYISATPSDARWLPAVLAILGPQHRGSSTRSLANPA